MDEFNNNGFGGEGGASEKETGNPNYTSQPGQNNQNQGYTGYTPNANQGYPPGGPGYPGYSAGYGYGQQSKYQQTGGPQTGGPQKAVSEDYTWNFEEYEDNGQKPGKHKKGKNRGLVVFASLLCAVFAVGVLGFAGYGVFSVVTSDHQEPEKVVSGEEEPLVSSEGMVLHDKPDVKETAIVSSGGELTAEQIADKVRPSVVGVVQYRNTLPYQNAGGTLPFQTTGEGSGIIMSEDGYIVTNAHVVANADGLKVVLDNGDEYEAQLIGSDTKTDLALLKIDAQNLTYAEFGNSDQLKQGETVYAIGNPGGLQLAGSMTQGIVSAINRPVKSEIGYTMECIQTDAAINPGNSGGALVNKYGQIVGINSSKIAATEYEGIGFAIPIAQAKPIIDQLKAYGHVTGRVRLGIEAYTVDEMLAKFNNIPTGIMVISIDEQSDLIAKGIAPGDILVELDGQKIPDTDTLYQVLENYKPGDQVKLKVYRRQQNGLEKNFEVTVALLEDIGS